MNQRRLLNIPVNKKEFASLKQDSFIWLAILSSCSLICLISILLLLNWNRLPPQLPLLFSLPWGEKQLVPPVGLWLLPAFSFSVLIFNLLLALFVPEKEILIRRILVSTSFVISLLCLLTIYKIINLIT